MKAVVFVPHNPFPCRAGAHRRMLEVLIGLRTLGVGVFLCGGENVSENPWTAEASAWFRDSGLCYGLSIYRQPRASRAQRVLRALGRAAAGIAKGRVTGNELRVDLTTKSMRSWFRKLIDAEAPDYVVINYAWFASLIPTGPAAPRSVVDAHDLITISARMRESVAAHIPSGAVFSPARMSEAALNLRFYDTADVSDAPAEFEALDKAEVTLAITERDAVVMRENTRRTQVMAAPTPLAVGNARSPHGAMALLPMGPHVFNLQGYAWFIRKVLPLIRAECPDFRLAVSGTIRDVTLEYHPDVRILGFVPDPADLWALGRMLVNPVFGGTGQPIKTIEAMAAGLPPVVLRHFAHAAPLVHEVNGFIADDEAQFAAYCIRLWKSPDLCWTMGGAAIEAVRTLCSRESFAASLSAAIREPIRTVRDDSIKTLSVKC